MSGTGKAVLDFGAFPGSTDASIAVTGQAGIVAGSLVEAWVFPQATADHSSDEHIVDPPRMIAGDIIAGTGFTIYGFTQNTQRHIGRYTVAWVWS